MRYSTLILASAVCATGLYAQDADASLQALIRAYQGQKGKILGGAQAMSDADYALKPGDGARTFAEVVGHIADAQAAGRTLDDIMNALGPVDALARAYALELAISPRSAPASKRLSTLAAR